MTLLWLAVAILVLVAATFCVGLGILRRLPKKTDSDLAQILREEFRLGREESSRDARALREEVANLQAKTSELLVNHMTTLGEEQKKALNHLAESTQMRLESVRKSTEEQLRLGVEDQHTRLGSVIAALHDFQNGHQQEWAKTRETLEQKFCQILESNEKKLEEMRQTVDEKLHNTLEQRLGESFKQVSDRLEAVHKGLGEVQSLASGVGDLKRVLTNVKERGTWGEYQLGAILEQILTPEQYEKNVAPTGGGERVEFAVKLPGRGSPEEGPVWLPIDAKFPKDDYERLLGASQVGDADGVKAASRALGSSVQKCAKDICEKYIHPPNTTDFAIMFLPTEGLYAEILRQPGLHDELQRKYRILAAGPTTLSAILSSLRIGFQTLSIEKRAHEVWTVLGAVKTQFGKFGFVLDKLKKQLETASNTVDKTAQRTRVMERKLREVEQLPAEQARAVIDLTDVDAAIDGDGTIEDLSGRPPEPV